MGKTERETKFLSRFEESIQEEEEVQPQSKIHFERNRLVEVQKEETV